jgi:hypothetical protein
MFILSSTFIISSHLFLRLSSCLLSSGFPTKIFYIFQIFPMSATCQAHLILLYLISLLMLRKEYELLMFLTMQFSPSSYNFLCSISKCVFVKNKFASQRKMFVFWDTVPCSLMEIPSSGPDDGGSKQLWNVSQFPPVYRVQWPRGQ